MSMRWMKLEAQTSVPSLYFLLFILNKLKIVFSVCFDLSMQHKNIPKIKVLRIPCQFYMIFSGIFKNLLCKNHPGGSCHLATRVEGAPPASWAHGGPPPLIPAPIHSFFLPKHEYPAQTRAQARFAGIFDLLAQSTSHKTAWGDCSLVCDSSIGPISFCSSALFFANLCCIGDHVLELACKIYMVLSSSNA